MNIWDPDDVRYQRCPSSQRGEVHTMGTRFTLLITACSRCRFCHRTAAQLRADARH